MSGRFQPAAGRRCLRRGCCLVDTARRATLLSPRHSPHGDAGLYIAAIIIPARRADDMAFHAGANGRYYCRLKTMTSSKQQRRPLGAMAMRGCYRHTADISHARAASTAVVDVVADSLRGHTVAPVRHNAAGRARIG